MRSIKPGNGLRNGFRYQIKEAGEYIKKLKKLLHFLELPYNGAVTEKSRSFFSLGLFSKKNIL